METLLLGFCVLSLVLSSGIVLVELIRDRRKSQRSRTKNQMDIERLGQSVLSLEKMTMGSPTPAGGAPLTQKNSMTPVEVLKQELTYLGYRTQSQQLKFLNWVLGARHHQLSELTAPEVKKVLVSVQRYKQAHDEVMPSLVPQGA